MTTRKLFSLTIASQLFFTFVLAPADGGRWLRYTIAYLMMLDLAYIVFLGLKAGHRVGKLTILGFVFASVAVAVVGTYLTEYFTTK
jgi:hypothetical protein